MKIQDNNNKSFLLGKLYQDKNTLYKVIVSIVFGLLGFALNFLPVDFVFYGSYRMSFLFGLIFPMLITLSWGWKYGLLSALCGGCQTMWILWLPGSGYGPFVSVPPFTLWIVWLGWFSRTGRNIYLGEVIFRIFNTLLLYTVFRWVFTLNSPPANPEIPLTVVNSIVFKEIVNGFLILSLARGLLYSKVIRRFFGLRETRADPRVYYVFLNILILAVMLTLILLGERFLWNNWSAEFRNMARLIGSLLLLVAGAFCLYGAAGEYVRRKIEGVVEHERKQQEFNQRYLDTIFRTSQDGIFTLDSDGNFELSNEATFRTLGWSKDELIGRSFMKVIPKDVHEFISERWAEVKRGEGTSYEVDILTKDGERRSLLISHKDMDIGGKRKYCVLIKDITELKLTERELTMHRNQLEEMVRELEAFSYSVSHDLRAPLRSIDGFSKLLLEECGDNLTEQGVHYLERVRAGAQNMDALIDDMLTLSQLGREPLKTETVDMTAIAEEARELLKDEWKDRKVDFTFHDCPEVNADHDLMRIVIVNLLSNALKFSRKREPAIIEFSHRIMDDQTVFFLRDNGIGFDMKFANKIFSPFQRLHRSEDYEGSGIGLTSVKRIIDRHGGRIWVESGPDSGTSCFFTVAGSEI